MYLCGPGKHNCQPFCGPEGRFYCSDSVCSLWPAPFAYLCVSVMILGVCWKLSAAEQVKTDCCHTPAVVSTLLTPLPVSCPLTTPHHYIYIYYSITTCITSVLISEFGHVHMYWFTKTVATACWFLRDLVKNCCLLLLFYTVIYTRIFLYCALCLRLA